MTFNLQQFRRACGRFPTGVTIATVCGADGSPHGVTVSSFTAVSLEPPLVLVCLDHRAQLVKHLPETGHFGINVLGEDQQELSRRFSQREAARFSDVVWYAGRTGAPLLPDCLATLECSVTQTVPAGDHVIFIGQVSYVTWCEGDPLAYFNGCYRKLQWEQSIARSQQGFLDGSDWSLIM